MRVAANAEAYRDWASTFDVSGSPIVALESRYLNSLLAGMAPSTVFDIGCGTGRWLTWLLARGHNALGVDSSPAMLRVAAAKAGLAGRIALADGRRAPLAPSSADLVLCCLTLAHLQPVPGSLAALASLARPGGRVVVTDFHPDAIRRGWKRTFQHNEEAVEIESPPYPLGDLNAPGLLLEMFLEPRFDEPERPLFEAAGKGGMFESACRHPALYVASFRRSAA